jgi:CBS domain-containing protein
MKVRDLMTYPIVMVDPNTIVKDALQMMANGNKGSVLVAKEGLLKEVEGIVTTSEIFKQIFAKGLDLEQTMVSEIMTPAPLITIEPNASTKEAAKCMKENNIRRLPVVESETLVGIITSKDLLECVE